ncbi:MAG: gliding motility protein GldM [Spirosomataceae bacterium]
MAGGKETPRQKMIGMMYLVLTAMLALQVSSALIEKFILLNNSLELSNSAANKLNDATVEKIKKAVEKLGNRTEDMAVLQKAKQVRDLTSKMVADLGALKEELITASGGRDEQGNFKNPKEEEKVAFLMVGPSKNGKAYALKTQLNSFVSELSKVAGTNFPLLALDGKEDPVASKSTEQRSKDFAQLNFEQTPLPAALAVLSQKESEIRRYEGETLDALASKVGAKDIKFDKILAMISAKSNTVVAGTPYEAQMFIAAYSSSIIPRMSINGSALKVLDGKGEIKFTAQGGGYDAKGLARKTYTGVVSFMSPSGRDTSFRIEQEYFVLKPTYNILTGTLPGLYLDCENKLEVVSPGLGALWQPSFSANGAETIRGARPGQVTIVPNSAKVDLNIINQGNTLGTEPFKVQRVPKPDIAVWGNGAPVDERRGMMASALRTIEIKCVADEGFKIACPNDANFRASSVTVNLVRGSRRIGNLDGSGVVNISGLAQQAQAGDRYVVEVKGVQRRNFKGEIKDVSVGTKLFNIPLN